jgi:hypothetical protein
MLHLNDRCSHIIFHVSNIMENNQISNIMNLDSKFAILIDYPTRISQTSVLTLHVQVFMCGTQMGKSAKLDPIVIELSDVPTELIFSFLNISLESVGFS